MNTSRAPFPDFKKITRAVRVCDGQKFRLKDHRPDDRLGFDDADKDRVKAAATDGAAALAEWQSKLYAENSRSLLLIFQAMDAAGKDGTIRHVMSGVNPQGCRVHAFKAPTDDDLARPFLHRATAELPMRGEIGIFNRSHYEETLVVRVHPQLLEARRLPGLIATDALWRQRLEDIRAFERHLARNGVTVLKFFLHLSKDEQRRRFLERLERPEKHWKFSDADIRDRAHWNDYQQAYEDTIRATATDDAPWHIIPADRKWLMRHAVTAVLLDTFERLAPDYPAVPRERLAALAAARRALLKEKD